MPISFLLYPQVKCTTSFPGCKKNTYLMIKKLNKGLDKMKELE